MNTFLGILATIIAIVGYIPYFRNIFRGKTKPHAFSWFVWFLLTAIAFFAQISDNAGPGAWVTGFTAIICFVIFIFGLKQGEKNIVLTDWLSLFGALAALGLWAITNDPLLSVILISLIDALGFVPTFRKSYFKPNEETALTYVLSALKFAVGIAALDNVTLVTALYPASLILMNGIFVIMVLARRQKLNGEIEHPF